MTDFFKDTQKAQLLKGAFWYWTAFKVKKFYLIRDVMFKAGTDWEKILVNHILASEYCLEYTKDYYKSWGKKRWTTQWKNSQRNGSLQKRNIKARKHRTWYMTSPSSGRCKWQSQWGNISYPLTNKHFKIQNLRGCGETGRVVHC